MADLDIMQCHREKLSCRYTDLREFVTCLCSAHVTYLRQVWVKVAINPGLEATAKTGLRARAHIFRIWTW